MLFASFVDRIRDLAEYGHGWWNHFLLTYISILGGRSYQLNSYNILFDCNVRIFSSQMEVYLAAEVSLIVVVRYTIPEGDYLSSFRYSAAIILRPLLAGCLFVRL